MGQSFLPEQFTPPHLLSGMPESTPILVGFSGGADSTALLHMLCRYGAYHHAEIVAVHINHGIRGEEALRDEAFCRSVAEQLGVRLFVFHADVPRLAEETAESIETAARHVRYRYFEQVMREQEIPLLATAHHANDNLETMLFNLTRGSGLGGVCGIPETRLCADGTVIRPILRMTREQILAYCRRHALSFVTDSTNTDTDYTRNKIRTELIPALTAINPQAVAHAAALSETLRADQLCLESMAQMFLSELRDGDAIETEKLNGSPDAVVNRALLSLYREVSDGKTLEYRHIVALKQLSLRAIPHSRVTLPHGWEAVIEDRRLLLRPRIEQSEPASYRIPLCEGVHRISQTDCEIVMRSSQKTKNIYKNSILFSIDSATINGMPYVRGREAGDRILLRGMHRSLKKLMCDKKIPTELRARLPILCDDDGILAVPLIGQRDGTLPRDAEEGSVDFLFRL